MAVCNNTNRVSSTFDTTAEHRVISKNCSDSSHNSFIMIAKCLDMCSGLFSSYPLGISSIAGNLTVHSHRILHCNIRRSCTDIMEKHMIHGITFFLEEMWDNFDSFFTKKLKSLTGYQRIRIIRTNDNSCNLLLNNCFCTRRCLSVMAARL